ncbi:YdeI/OmpD-associated family protein [Microbacterium sp. Marseille-Q6965]|uniref:YdeI/OmpD-associated family protein n=1 Tax=Microbacterium sp. Marseille-Q6965 TaxID=2965072 RepID=UPI0021B7858A|nr:YdeI/OmpD-associated family protein [Microbacterium sp. Marseille-Q6965]
MTTLTFSTVLEAYGPAAAIILTDQQVAHLGGARNAPVVVTIGDRTARLRLARMGVDNLIGLSKAARAELDVEIGDAVEVVIELDTAERTVDVPDALRTALAADADLQRRFDALSYSRRKELARSVADAKQDATRERRVQKALDELRG